MRVTTDKGLELGFFQRSDTVAEIAFDAKSYDAPKIGDRIRINDIVWRVTSVKPSEYVRTLKVATLWQA